MKWSDLKGIIGSAAPLIGTAIGGPAGAAIGAMVSQGLGVENTPKAVSDAIEKNPESLLALKKIEQENESSLRDYAFKVLDAELKDVQDARSSHKHSPMPMVICLALTAMVSLGAAGLFTLDIPPENKEIAYLLFGTLLAKWGDSIAYWVGTTRSSAEKSKGLLK